MNILGFSFGKKKKEEKPIEKVDAQVEDNQEEVDDFDGDKSNDIKVLRKEEPKWRGLKRKYIYYGLMLVCLTTVFAIMTGLEDDKKRAEQEKARRVTEIKDSKAVAGEHLLNIPKDYKEHAELEAKKKAELERMKAKMEEDKKPEAKAKEKVDVPTNPQVPPQPSYRHELTPAEKAELMRIEMKKKALESPIGFELKEEG